MIVVLGLGRNKSLTPIGNICCSMTWWSWLFVAYNLFGPTCLLKAVEHLVGAQIFDTKSIKDLFSFCVNIKRVVGLKKIVVLGFL
jgi:hypothetical protein